MSITSIMLFGGFVAPKSKSVKRVLSDEKFTGNPRPKDRAMKIRERIMASISDESWTAHQMAEEVGTSYRASLYNLEKLHKEGFIKKQSFFGDGGFKKPNIYWK